MRRCPDCGLAKPFDEFYRSRHKKHGYSTYCKPCHLRRGRESVKKNYGNSRHYHLKQRFGIGAAEVDAMIEAQGGLCPICQKRAAVHVDHDHKTGKVRAILCEPCNGGLGQFKDDPQIIRNAIAYLKNPQRGRSSDEALPAFRPHEALLRLPSEQVSTGRPWDLLQALTHRYCE